MKPRTDEEIARDVLDRLSSAHPADLTTDDVQHALVAAGRAEGRKEGDMAAAALTARVEELRGLLSEWWEDNPPDICSCDSDKECDGTCWCQRVRQVLKRDEIAAACARAALGGGKGEE